MERRPPGWTVPGKTARRRIDRWLASEDARRSPFEEERGRGAYQFEPILSPYLQAYDLGFRIKTPFSRTVVDELRRIVALAYARSSTAPASGRPGVIP
nr:hypothetical protein [Rhizobium ruizarguesonis]